MIEERIVDGRRRAGREEDGEIITERNTASQISQRVLFTTFLTDV